MARQRPRELDDGVVAAYGWNADISDKAALQELLELNVQSQQHQLLPAGHLIHTLIHS